MLLRALCIAPLSPDPAECQHSSYHDEQAKPTLTVMTGLRHLCLYVLSIEEQALQMKPVERGRGLLGQTYAGENAVLERYIDSDWASNKVHGYCRE